jgi:hypothetical protein
MHHMGDEEYENNGDYTERSIGGKNFCMIAKFLQFVEFLCFL